MKLLSTMYFDEHNPPHLHARYQDQNATFDFDGNLLAGELLRKQTKLVETWIVIHQEELNADWDIISEGEGDFAKIEPLR